MILSDNRETIIREIFSERIRQAVKFPGDEECQLDVFFMNSVALEELGEVAKAAIELRAALIDDCDIDRREKLDSALRAEIVQFTAVGFKMLEAHAQGRLCIDDGRPARREEKPQIAQIYADSAPAQKPPLGIIPTIHWKEARIRELVLAIQRYTEAGLFSQVAEWSDEIAQLSSEIRDNPRNLRTQKTA